MVAPLVIAGVRILAPIATRYAAGKLSKRAAVKASKELAKKGKASAKKAAREKVLKGAKVITDKEGRKITKYPFDKSAVEKSQTSVREFGGSSAKKPSLGGYDNVKMKYKKGGAVKKCRMDGIALRGKTRAKERSK